MKKRTLLVSTAILLVAVMALATASFAWFTAGSTATAKGFNISTVAGTNLQIAKKAVGTFAKEQDVAMTKTDLMPVSSINGQNFWALKDTSGILAGASGALAAGAVPANTIEAVATGNRVEEAFYLKNAGPEDLTVKATITVTPAADNATSNDVAKSIRVALLVKEAGESTFAYTVFAPYGAHTAATNVINAAGDTVVEDVDVVDGTTASIITTLSPSSMTGYDNTNDAEVVVVIWFEGQDADCTGSNASALQHDGIDVTVVFDKNV